MIFVVKCEQSLPFDSTENSMDMENIMGIQVKDCMCWIDSINMLWMNFDFLQVVIICFQEVEVEQNSIIYCTKNNRSRRIKI